MNLKLAISTLGCPDWSFDAILKNYAALGIRGVEVRGIEGATDASEIPYFSEENAAKTKERLAAHGLTLIGFGTSAMFHDADRVEGSIAEAKRAIEVCRRMGIPYIRVFGDRVPQEADAKAETLRRICDALEILCREGEANGVGILLEIHGNVNCIEHVKPILDAVGHNPAFGILWDVQHSDKVYGDGYEPFYELIRPYIRHVHLKDHRRGGALTAVGAGDIPLVPIVRRLMADGYDGYLSLEWEKKWHPELDAPEIAFPAFVRFMEQFR